MMCIEETGNHIGVRIDVVRSGYEELLAGELRFSQAEDYPESLRMILWGLLEAGLSAGSEADLSAGSKAG